MHSLVFHPPIREITRPQIAHAPKCFSCGAPARFIIRDDQGKIPLCSFCFAHRGQILVIWDEDRQGFVTLEQTQKG